MWQYFTTGSTFATTGEASRNVTLEEKIDSAIWQNDVDEYGRYLVYVSRTEVSDSKIEKEFNKRSEYPLSYYEDKVIYRAKVGPEVASNALEEYGLDESLSLEYGQEIFDDNNVEIIEFTATEAGTYDIKCGASYSLMSSQSDVRGKIFVAWRIID